MSNTIFVRHKRAFRLVVRTSFVFTCSNKLAKINCVIYLSQSQLLQVKTNEDRTTSRKALFENNITSITTTFRFTTKSMHNWDIAGLMLTFKFLRNISWRTFLQFLLLGKQELQDLKWRGYLSFHIGHFQQYFFEKIFCY